MKWTPKRVVALSAVGLIAWGASSATGDERGSTAPPQVAGQTLSAATGPGQDAATVEPAAGASSVPAQTTAGQKLSSPTAPSTSPAPASATGTAAAVLARLPVKGRAPMTGYTRAQFGQAWSDDVSVAFGHNGCDTRNDILRRDLRKTALKAGTNGCVVLTGSFTEPYSGRAVSFTRGAGTSSLVQIDHVVALADAWQSGAQQWNADTRRGYANDPLVLLAADGHLNQQKGASNAASWLPPNRTFRCPYVARQVAIKAKYHLWVTAPERDAIARVLSTCRGQPLPTDASASALPKPAASPAPVKTSSPAPTRPPAPAPAVVPTPKPAGEEYYKNCTAVRAAGAAPIHVGELGYSRRLDRDGDGIACE